MIKYVEINTAEIKSFEKTFKVPHLNLIEGVKNIKFDYDTKFDNDKDDIYKIPLYFGITKYFIVFPENPQDNLTLTRSMLSALKIATKEKNQYFPIFTYDQSKNTNNYRGCFNCAMCNIYFKTSDSIFYDKAFKSPKSILPSFGIKTEKVIKRYKFSSRTKFIIEENSLKLNPAEIKNPIQTVICFIKNDCIELLMDDKITKKEKNTTTSILC